MSHIQKPGELPVPKSRPSIHQTILKWFEKAEKGTVLDAPAGFGHLSMKLKELGFDVTGGEIEPDIFVAPDQKCIYTDLNNHIDAPDNSFDYVCCVDGLEHMTNPYKAVEEFSRVLKPGGVGVFSIPNYCNIEKRLRFVFFGHNTKPIDMESFEKQGRNLFNFHNSPLTITLLDDMFTIYGLELEDILVNAKKKKQYLLYPLVLFIKFIAWISPEKAKKKHRYHLTTDNRIILGGNNIILITRKK